MSIRRSLLQGISASGTSASRGGLTDIENAKNLANRTFKFYNKDQSGYLDDYEIGSMISDVYADLKKDFNPSSKDIEHYIKSHDQDKDGRLSLKDLEELFFKYLV